MTAPRIPAQRAACGTNAGCIAHRKKHEQPCEPCLAAAAAHMRAYRRRTGRTTHELRPLTPVAVSGTGWPSEATR